MLKTKIEKSFFLRQTLRIPDLSVKSIFKAKTNHPESVRRIVNSAKTLLHCECPSVIDKTIVPPSGSKHDYASLSIYYWPDPEKRDGKPYKCKDGKINPEVMNTDYAAFATFVNSLDLLITAWQLTGVELFAIQAADWINRWFLDEATRMNPNMNWAQFVPGEGLDEIEGPGGYPYRYIIDEQSKKGMYCAFGGTIDACCMIIIPELIRILNQGGFMDNASMIGLKKWFSDFIEWLQTSIPGCDALKARNNHGAWYLAYMSSFALFCEDYLLLEKLCGDMLKNRIMQQIEPDGSQPEELYRANSFGYSVFTLNAFSNTAITGSIYNKNLWDILQKPERRMISGLDFILPAYSFPDDWKYPQHAPVEDEPILFVLSAFNYLSQSTDYSGYIRDVLAKGTNTSVVHDLSRILYS